MRIASACLLGVKCNYAGGCFASRDLGEEFSRGEVFPVCPEVFGGLPTPRTVAEIVGGDGGDVLDGRASVMTAEGADVTEAFLAGARATLRVAQALGATEAMLIEMSPSCGSSTIFDGSFSGGTKPGDGVTAALLLRHGITIIRVPKPADS
jgi:uncharacterized protein YbbK (DUF523 family)